MSLVKFICNKRIINSMVSIFIICCLYSSFAQTGHSYPRVGVFTWGGAPAEWYAEFDLIFSWSKDADLVKEIKAINPSTLVVNTADWNTGAYIRDGLPDEFVLKNSLKDVIGFYVGSINIKPEQQTPNFSSVCPTVNGKQCNEFFARYVTDRVDLNIFDGVGTDGFFGGKEFLTYRIPKNRDGRKDIDLDRNEVNDLNEHDLEWILDKWTAGTKKMLKRIREIIGPEKLIIVNSGLGFSGHPEVGVINGAVLEYAGYGKWGYLKNKYVNFMKNAHQPQVTIYAANPHGYDKNRPPNDKNYFQFLRMSLAQAMMGNAYYHFEPDQPKSEHYYNKYFDEFDLDIGYPTSNMIQLSGRKVWVRFFDGGCAILSKSEDDQIVTDQELKTLQGYTGPYWKFKGSQCPDNDGTLAESVLLKKNNFTWKDSKKKEHYVVLGDGIVLVNQPTICIADIIIDNTDIGTSPGSEQAVLKGNWMQVAKKNDHWRIRVSAAHRYYGYAYTTDKNANAVYVPQIGVAGKYEVFEWHGYHGDNPEQIKEAKNVPYTITYASGAEETGVINQSTDYGKWNSLGTYLFEKGTNNKITITGNAEGVVIADAFKLILKRGDEDNTLPSKPSKLRYKK